MLSTQNCTWRVNMSVICHLSEQVGSVAVCSFCFARNKAAYILSPLVHARSHLCHARTCISTQECGYTACMRVHTPTNTRMSMDLHTRIAVRVGMHANTRSRMHSMHANNCAFTQVQTQANMHTHAHKYTHARTHIRAHTRTRACQHTWIYMHNHDHTPMHTRICHMVLALAYGIWLWHMALALAYGSGSSI